MEPDDLLRLLRLDPDTGKLFWREHPSIVRRLWGRQGFQTLTMNGYLSGTIKGKRLYTHRVAFALAHGRWPEGTIDHINGNKTDNRVENLRDVTHAENHRNMPMPATNKSGVVGVRWNPNKSRWHAQIKRDGQVTFLGSFKSKDEAVAERKAAERRLGFHTNHGVRNV